MKQKQDDQFIVYSLESAGILRPGRYYFLPTDGVELRIEGIGLPIVPTSRLMKHLNSPNYIPASKKLRVETLAAEDTESITSNDYEFLKQSSQFRENIIARDSHCVVTRKYVNVKATHILAQDWWHDTNHKEHLPSHIQQLIPLLPQGINGVMNGVLLEIGLAAAFDEGFFSFVLRDGHYYVVAITTQFLDLDGIQLDEHLRERSDGTCWWSEGTRPHPRLVEFHFRNSVFKHMRPSRWTEYESDSDSSSF
ncbi:hypothetical protein BCR33DRAFT_738262 [Rhizoclosmatium globosum]|uniref:Uncharacterized protein n=1 Tax=Rhizoclosmatium globosum TaxID=329046 RepID=A0A1Y2CB19_9FUNG|nr:hypothetical protein BCR33DRAFT_738262 [Rhizoclosmatium globosum]|eukprot:ORY44097.1 hypothetical protein BCR33DRAFT_738262 [Rhizoclosmatium globosum]